MRLERHLPAVGPGQSFIAARIVAMPNETSADDTTSVTSGSMGVAGCSDDNDYSEEATPFCSSNGDCIGCDAQPDPDGGCAGLGA